MKAEMKGEAEKDAAGLKGFKFSPRARKYRQRIRISHIRARAPSYLYPLCSISLLVAGLRSAAAFTRCVHRAHITGTWGVGVRPTAINHRPQRARGPRNLMPPPPPRHLATLPVTAAAAATTTRHKLNSCGARVVVYPYYPFSERLRATLCFPCTEFLFRGLLTVTNFDPASILSPSLAPSFLSRRVWTSLERKEKLERNFSTDLFCLSRALGMA